MCFPGSKSAWDDDVVFVKKGPRPSRKPKETETIILRKTYSPVKTSKPPFDTQYPSKVSKATPALVEESAPPAHVLSTAGPVVDAPASVLREDSLPKPDPMAAETSGKKSPVISRKPRSSSSSSSSSSSPPPPPSPHLEFVYVEEERDGIKSKKRSKSRPKRTSTHGSRKETLSWTMARDLSRANLPAAPTVPQYDTYRYIEGRNPRYSSDRERR
ncbi:hypothetical protein K3495_g10234 [Podosphaera aphanis]|nr:hypothetical protein K3495_g10234 [Podosphaera aphanis]